MLYPNDINVSKKKCIKTLKYVHNKKYLPLSDLEATSTTSGFIGAALQI